MFRTSNHRMLWAGRVSREQAQLPLFQVAPSPSSVASDTSRSSPSLVQGVAESQEVPTGLGKSGLKAGMRAWSRAGRAVSVHTKSMSWKIAVFGSWDNVGNYELTPRQHNGILCWEYDIGNSSGLFTLLVLQSGVSNSPWIFVEALEIQAENEMPV